MLEAGIKPVYGTFLALMVQRSSAPVEALTKAPSADMSLMASLRQ